MADFIAVNSTANFANLVLNADGVNYTSNVDAAFESVAGIANAMPIPALQEITVNATPGTFNWQQLDELSEKVVTTPSTNSISVTLVLDPVTFFDGKANTDGIFDIVNNKTETYFRLYWQGNGSGDRYIQGKGYLSALAPTVSPGAPVWTSPLEILVTGSYETGTV
jgi:hypothetical protein